MRNKQRKTAILFFLVFLFSFFSPFSFHSLVSKKPPGSNLGVFSIFQGMDSSLQAQNKSRYLPHGLNKGYELFVNDFGAPLHLEPSKSSRVLKFLPYGSSVDYDSHFLHSPNKHWLPVIEKSGLSGYVMRSQILEFPKKKKFSFIAKDIDSKIAVSKKYPEKVNLYELTDYLFAIVKEGEFTGNEYLFLKGRGGEALALAILQNHEKGIDDTFLARYERYLTRGGGVVTVMGKDDLSRNQNSIRLDENYFWKQASLNQKSPYGDYAGVLAVRYTPVPDCEGEPGCFLDYINYTYLKYLGMFPRGKKRNLFTKRLLEETREFTKDPEHIRCFPPLPRSAWVSLERAEFRIQYLSGKNYQKMKGYLNRLREECYPSLESTD